MMKQLMTLVTGILATAGLLLGLSGITGRAATRTVMDSVSASEQVMTHISQQPPEIGRASQPIPAVVLAPTQQRLPQTDETNPLKLIFLGVVLLGLSIISHWNLFDRKWL